MGLDSYTMKAEMCTVYQNRNKATENASFSILSKMKGEHQSAHQSVPCTSKGLMQSGCCRKAQTLKHYAYSYT